jgi:hypothetical protein
MRNNGLPFNHNPRPSFLARPTAPPNPPPAPQDITKLVIIETVLPPIKASGDLVHPKVYPKRSWGGARKNAGRKVSDSETGGLDYQYTLRLSYEQYSLVSLRGATWLRDLITKAIQ